MIDIFEISYTVKMRMERQYYSHSSKTKMCRFYTVLVCLYPTQECSVGLGNGDLLQGVHATGDFWGNGDLL